jgi:hypothetical protein
MSGEDLDLTGNLDTDWDNYTSELKRAGITLHKAAGDTLLWTGGDSYGNLSVKNIYDAIISTQDLPICHDWKVNLWKWNLQLKIKLVFWLVADNRS